MFSASEIATIREQFPALRREQGGEPVVYLDGPAGAQVPQRVADAVTNYMFNHNANSGGAFVTSMESDALLEDAQAVMAAFYGTQDPDSIVFGPNMTSLTYAMSRSMAGIWRPGDEIIVSQLDHDANVTPWLQAAKFAGVKVHQINVNPENCTLDLDDYEKKLSERTRLVAVGLASNATGTVNPIRAIADRAHAVGAWVYVDAVHYAPHGLIDVDALGCDFLVSSAYKFFGPHVGILWGKRELLESLPAHKLRPSGNDVPGRFMLGTPNLEGIAGSREAVHYLASLGAQKTDAEELRPQLVAAFQAIEGYERMLAHRFLEAAHTWKDVRIWGITDPAEFDQRVPTVSLTHTKVSPKQLSEALAAEGIFTWYGNHYALPLTEAVGLEPDGTLRMGLLHYNTMDEVERLISALAKHIS